MNRRKAILGITLAGAGLAAAIGGFKWHSVVKSPDLAYAENNKELIAALAETILPATDTPGARDAGVPDFILRMLKSCLERKEQNAFIDGLKDVQAHVKAHYNTHYESCSAGQQQQIMTWVEEKDRIREGRAGKLRLRLLGRPFFTLLKAYTVEGYCTSQAGATKGLTYVYIPGRFQGCIPLEPGQKAWATN